MPHFICGTVWYAGAEWPVKSVSRFRNIALPDRCPGYLRKDRDVSGPEWPGGLMDDLLPEEPDSETIYLITNDGDNVLGWDVLDVISELNGNRIIYCLEKE